MSQNILQVGAVKWRTRLDLGSHRQRLPRAPAAGPTRKHELGGHVYHPTLAETSLVFIGRRGGRNAEVVQGLIEERGVSVVSLGPAEWPIAAEAFRRFGRGRHPAALNFGDCLGYATAKALRGTLLSVGNDFSKTGIKSGFPEPPPRVGRWPRPSRPARADRGARGRWWRAGAFCS